MSLLRHILAAFAARRSDHADSAVAAAEPIPRPVHYHAYTKAYDRVIRLDEVEQLLGPMSEADAREYEAIKKVYREDLGEWRASANAKALLLRNKMASLAPRRTRAATAATILLDLSGSMRGQRIIMTVANLEVFGTMLEALGVRTEILGFTTVAWKGGEARKEWLSSGRPPWPGRLNDLLHVIVADAGHFEAVRLTKLHHLLRPDLLKENVDGEAIQWACERLKARKAQRRSLIVISDGAPVDDSTIASNDTALLPEHLKMTILDAEKDGIQVLGIGIDFDVRRYYKKAVLIDCPDRLFGALASAARWMLTDRTGDDAPTQH